MLNQSLNHNITLTPTVTPNRTLKLKPNGKVFLKKQKKVTKVRFELKTNGILDIVAVLF